MPKTKTHPAKFLCVPALMLAAGTLASCNSAEDPDDPGFNEPAVTGVFRGEISSVKEYRDAVRKENLRANREGPRWNDNFNDEDFRD